jgi:hypothetical protein
LVYVAVATLLEDQPGATAMALTVVVVRTRIGPVYSGDEAVGVLPSVV